MRFSGLGFRPMPPESNVESTLIWYKSTDKNNIKYWTEEIDKFLAGNLIGLQASLRFLLIFFLHQFSRVQCQQRCTNDTGGKENR